MILGIRSLMSCSSSELMSFDMVSCVTSLDSFEKLKVKGKLAIPAGNDQGLAFDVQIREKIPPGEYSIDVNFARKSLGLHVGKLIAGMAAYKRMTVSFRVG